MLQRLCVWDPGSAEYPRHLPSSYFLLQVMLLTAMANEETQDTEDPDVYTKLFYQATLDSIATSKSRSLSHGPESLGRLTVLRQSRKCVLPSPSRLFQRSVAWLAPVTLCLHQKKSAPLNATRGENIFFQDVSIIEAFILCHTDHLCVPKRQVLCFTHVG